MGNERLTSLIAIGLVSMSVASATEAQTTTGSTTAPVSRPFVPGERLSYDVYFGAIKVGTGSMEVRGIDTLLAADASFSAVCCANDQLALGALRRLAELGISVPEQISVAGFDDIPVAAMTAPSLSTVRLPLREIGRRGFEAAVRQMSGEEVKPQLLPTELVLRDSTQTRGDQ